MRIVLTNSNAEVHALSTSLEFSIKSVEVKKLNEIGRGGGGVVYKGEMKIIGSPPCFVAIKQIIASPDTLIELYNNSFLKHANLVQYYGTIISPDFKEYQLIFEYMDGDLTQWHPNSFPNVKEAFIQVAKALLYMHTLNTMHRDCKPQNILYKNGEVVVFKLGDFGTSKPISHANNSIVGTTDFMAPEINGDHYTNKVDIFSFGKTMRFCRSMWLTKLEFNWPELWITLEDQLLKQKPDDRPCIKDVLTQLMRL